MNELPQSPAAQRNKQPILEVLQQVLPAHGHALEIASGTGQHAAWFAAGLPGWTWQASETDPLMLPVIQAWVEDAGVPNVAPPVLLDVMDNAWPCEGPAFSGRFDAIYCANMLHIAPWAACTALMRGSVRHLAAGGLLVIYGPFLEEGVPTAPGNLAFNESLRHRDPAWGLRQLDAVVLEAQRVGLSLRGRHAMPANNLLLVFGFAGT